MDGSNPNFVISCNKTSVRESKAVFAVCTMISLSSTPTNIAQAYWTKCKRTEIEALLPPMEFSYIRCLCPHSEPFYVPIFKHETRTPSPLHFAVSTRRSLFRCAARPARSSYRVDRLKINGSVDVHAVGVACSVCSSAAIACLILP